jgi:hypothetical protein
VFNDFQIAFHRNLHKNIWAFFGADAPFPSYLVIICQNQGFLE